LATALILSRRIYHIIIKQKVADTRKVFTVELKMKILSTVIIIMVVLSMVAQVIPFKISIF